MTKMAELAGVAHNIAHHAASGLSFLYPHLAQALQLAGEETTAIELLVQHPYPSQIAEMQSLRLALTSLKTKALSILQNHGFHQNDLHSIVLHAALYPGNNDGSLLRTRTVITARSGRVYDSGWLQPA